jgi:phospholipase/carboxylesterase
MGIYEGRAWFSIDMEALDRAIRTGEFRDLASNIPPEFDVTIKQQENFLREIAQRHKEITLCGFSQGAMCAFHLATKGSLPVVGLILLSAGLIAEERLPQVSRSIPFYQSHGTKDPILSLSGAKKLEEKLLKMNFQGKLEIFDGGHEIPLKVIEGVKKFLQKTLSDE